MAKDNVPWTKIRREYLGSEISQRALAMKYGVPVKTLESRAKKEGWTSARRKTWEKIRAKEPERIARAYAQRFESAANALLERLENAALDRPSGPKHVKSVTTERLENGGERVTVRDVYSREEIPFEDPGQLRLLIESAQKLGEVMHGITDARGGSGGMQIEFVGDAEELAE